MRRPAISLLDAGLAVGAGLAIALEATLSHERRGAALANVALCFAICVPLVWRRRAPLATAVAVGALATLQTATLTPLPPLVTPIALALIPAYSVGAYGGRRGRALAGLAICLLGAGALELAAPASERDLAGLLPSCGIALLAWLAGRAVRAQTSRAERLAALDVQLREGRAARERLAVAEQRFHVARELHDVVAHGMTVICLQAGAAQRVWWSRPDEARRALAVVGDTARGTLVQLRDVLGLLDPDGPPTHLGVDELESLAARARVGGLTVHVEVDGDARALPGPVGLVAYRVIQEALTNAVRHAAPTDVAVRLRYEPHVLSVDVRDSGRARGRDLTVVAAGSGSGLQGMRERVERCAGSLSYGPRRAGGFAVSARLPLEAGR